ncbi:hypothetical protein C8R44DRAFT_944305 [Mycena epipterygia]|nr:hypothetical protein C8R44DRAFT_944305 [Mycena epipterygia]
MVDLRATFRNLPETPYQRAGRLAGMSYFAESRPVITIPHLRLASLAVDGLTIEEILACFEFPLLEGLNLKLQKSHPWNVLCPVPGQLKMLKILRLCGGLEISNMAFTCILTDIPTLTDFSVELRRIDAKHMFTLLTPNTELVLVLKLQALRACLAMLRARFGRIAGTEFALLRLFSLWMWWGTPPPLSASLASLRVQEEWGIRVNERWRGDFWNEDMDDMFF